MISKALHALKLRWKAKQLVKELGVKNPLVITRIHIVEREDRGFYHHYIKREDKPKYSTFGPNSYLASGTSHDDRDCPHPDCIVRKIMES